MARRNDGHELRSELRNLCPYDPLHYYRISSSSFSTPFALRALGGLP
jgi:hypothetical protein